MDAQQLLIPGSEWNVQRLDALDFVLSLPELSIDLAILDPPHSGLEKHRAIGTTTRLVRRWFPVVDDLAIVKALDTLYHHMKPNAHCWVFCDVRLEHVLIEALTNGAIGVRRRDDWCCWGSWVWSKIGKLGMGYHGRRQHERILFLEKGKRKLTDLGVPDVLCAKMVTKADVGRDVYPTEKPVELLRRLVRLSSQPGEWVLDCWCGSGSVGVAALAEGRRFVGSDVEASAVELTRARLAGESR